VVFFFADIAFLTNFFAASNVDTGFAIVPVFTSFPFGETWISCALTVFTEENKSIKEMEI
jgi:hypothetical protein